MQAHRFASDLMDDHPIVTIFVAATMVAAVSVGSLACFWCWVRRSGRRVRQAVGSSFADWVLCVHACLCDPLDHMATVQGVDKAKAQQEAGLMCAGSLAEQPLSHCRIHQLLQRRWPSTQQRRHLFVYHR